MIGGVPQSRAIEGRGVPPTAVGGTDDRRRPSLELMEGRPQSLQRIDDLNRARLRDGVLQSRAIEGWCPSIAHD